MVWIYRPLFTNYSYGIKEENIYVSDRRYKTGRRYEGSKLVVDKSVTIPYNDKQRILSRVEGFLKLIILITFLILAHLYNSKQKLASPPKTALTIKNLSIGSTLEEIKHQERTKLRSQSDGSYHAEKTKYAKEGGRFNYWLKDGRLDRIEFQPQDSTAFYRLSTLLVAKYGPAQDSASNYYVWKNDSLVLTLKNNPDLSLSLGRVSSY
ncbi:hypothetical protein GCM10028773_58480 [Spirosoma koreense]